MGTDFQLPKDFEQRWEAIPTELAGRALIVPYIYPILIGRKRHPTIEYRLYSGINTSYFKSYVDEFEACTVGNLVYLAAPHAVPSHGKQIPYDKLLDITRRHGILEKLTNCKASKLLEIKNYKKWVKCKIEAHQLATTAQVTRAFYSVLGKRRNAMEQLLCFIVHGHDNEAKLELKDYLQNTLRLPEPIILHQQPNKGKTVIEKFEEHSDKIDVAFVLLTPDDIGGITEVI